MDNTKLNSNVPITHLDKGSTFIYEGKEYTHEGSISVAAQCVHAKRVEDDQSFVFDHRHVVELKPNISTKQ